MLGLALKGLLIVAVAGLLAAAIFIVARVIAGILLVILFIGAMYLVLKTIGRERCKSSKARKAG